MTDKNEQKNFSDKNHYLGIRGIFKIFTGDIKELYTEFFGKSNLESKTKYFEQNSSASLKKQPKYDSYLEDFKNHEAINSSMTPQKNNCLQKNNVFSFYSASFGI